MSVSLGRRGAFCVSVVAVMLQIPTASATPVAGSVLTPPGAVVIPGLTADPAGTLLASIISPWSFTIPSANSTSGTLRTAVFRNVSGTLDFYYQITNAAPSSTDIERLSAVNFLGFQTWTAFRMDGGALPGGVLVNSDLSAWTATRDISSRDVGFSFGPSPTAYVSPGRSSSVLIISTDATSFTNGNTSLIGGGTAVLSAFQPTGPTNVPEPSTTVLMAVAGLVLLAWKRIRKQVACGFAVVTLAATAVHATPLTGTSLTPAGTLVLPGMTSDLPGALLASLVAPWSFNTTAGTTIGSLYSAVFRNTTGTLDFYYQVMNSANSATGIERLTAANFAGYATSTGYRSDGSLLSGAGFVNGTVAPYVASRGVNGIVASFQFGLLPADWILPGLTSNVLVLSTDATQFTAGNTSIIDGGASTVAAFMPLGLPGDVPTPEPQSALLITAGVAMLAFAKLARRP